MADAAKKKEKQPQNETAPQLLTMKEAARYLGLSVWALRERVWKGHIPFVRFPKGKKFYFRRKDLDGFIEENSARYI